VSRATGRKEQDMIRTFEHPEPSGEWIEVSTIDTETGDLVKWCECAEVPRFSEWRDNIFNMGWESVAEFIKNRRNKAWRWTERIAAQAKQTD